MGADIYLDSVYQKARSKFEDKFHAAAVARDRAIDMAKARGKDPHKDKTVKARQKEVSEYYEAMYPEEGYFRDSYNGGSLFWALGLSWWNDVDNKLVNKNGYLPLRNISKLRKMVSEAPLTLDGVRAQHSKEKLGETPEEWLQHWEDKRKKFLAMLDRSQALGEPLRMSL